MVLRIADRVFEKSAFTGGTGAVGLAVSAEADCQTFLAGWGASGTGYYCLVGEGTGKWETGKGTLNAGGTTLTRTTVYHGSSGAGVAVSFTAGTLNCFGDLPASQIMVWENQDVLWANDPPFNAVADGGTDDHIALQACIDAAIAAGKPARFRGLCYSSLSLTINGSIDFGGSVTGSFFTGSCLLFPANVNGITITAPSAVKLHDFGMTVGVATTGAGVYVTDATTQNTGSIFDNLNISSFAEAIHFEKADSWVVENCYFQGCTSTTIKIKNTYNADSGDSVMYGCTLYTDNALNAITWESSGGLKLIGNKINGGLTGIKLNLVAGAQTSILNVTGNSIEGVVTGISLVRQGAAPTTTFKQVQISCNEIAGTDYGIVVPTDATGQWINSIAITGNSIACSIAAIDIDHVNGPAIAGNVLWNSGFGTATAITLRSGVTNASIGFNPRIGTFSAGTFSADSIASGAIGSEPTILGGTLNVTGLIGAGTASGGASLNALASDSLYAVKLTRISGPAQVWGIGVENPTGSLFIDNITGGGTRVFDIFTTGEVVVNKLNVSNRLALADGISAPSTVSGQAQIYVDISDGDLKVKFGDGTIKTIVTD